jgi:hypothetical protein
VRASPPRRGLRLRRATEAAAQALEPKVASPAAEGGGGASGGGEGVGDVDGRGRGGGSGGEHRARVAASAADGRRARPRRGPSRATSLTWPQRSGHLRNVTLAAAAGPRTDSVSHAVSTATACGRRAYLLRLPNHGAPALDSVQVMLKRAWGPAGTSEWDSLGCASKRAPRQPRTPRVARRASREAYLRGHYGAVRAVVICGARSVQCATSPRLGGPTHCQPGAPRPKSKWRRLHRLA